MSCTPELYVKRFDDMEAIREKYYLALYKSDHISYNLYLEDEIRNIDVYDTNSVIETTKKILGQANLCFELKRKNPDSEEELSNIEAHLRYVILWCRRHLENYHGVTTKYTNDLNLKFY